MSEQSEQLSKEEILAKIRSEHELLTTSSEGIATERYLQPGIEGNWTLKDVLAHITAWEQRMIEWLADAKSGEVPPIPQTWDEVHALNAESYEKMKNQPLSQIQDKFQRSFVETVLAVESTSPEMLETPNYFEWRDGALWPMVAHNTFYHYKEHREAIQKWNHEG